jgi:hypothetical protein
MQNLNCIFSVYKGFLQWLSFIVSRLWALNRHPVLLICSYDLRLTYDGLDRLDNIKNGASNLIGDMN